MILQLEKYNRFGFNNRNMGLLSKIFSNTRKPEGFFGRMMVNGMNGGGHARLAEWGLSFVKVAEDADVLDVGCGGGANIARHLNRCPRGKVTGIDYSPVSVKKSREVNAAAIAAGRCKVVEGSADALPFEDVCFDLVTAFETVYFWPSIEECELRTHLSAAGFRDIAVHNDEKNHWLCVSAVK